MTNLNFPVYDFKIKSSAASDLIFDEFRKKWVALTPEEWVRQHLACYLMQDKNFPQGLIALEYQLKVNTRVKRSDIVCFNHQKEAVLLAECKAPEVSVSQKTFDQIIQYNFHFKVKYLLVSNGLNHYCCYADFAAHKVSYLKAIPDFKEL
ncbi:MAG: restriction endonuclease subunit R [Bacteroidetes bacterium]|nr:restriction endonuclease subunit R [Bacteroidota bacterium]